MGRVSRGYSLPSGATFHSMWKALNGAFFLRFDNMKTLFLRSLFRFFKRALGQVELHGFCVMDNHFHKAASLLAESEHYSNWVRSAHSSFSLLFNRSHGKRRGPVVQERPKTVLVQDQESLKRLMFYIDYNPVRAGIVSKPEDYRFSTYRYYAYGEKAWWTEHITPPPWYLELSDDPKERQRLYREMAREYDRKKLLPENNEADEGHGLGSPHYIRRQSFFMAAIEKRLREATADRKTLKKLALWALGWDRHLQPGLETPSLGVLVGSNESGSTSSGEELPATATGPPEG